jgi:hypothetical protein
VKSIDKDWKKHIKNADGSRYCDNYCPLSGSYCRKEDCSFWIKNIDKCGYIQKTTHSKYLASDIGFFIDRKLP